MGRREETHLRREQVQRYLREHLHDDVAVTELRPLGGEGSAGKEYGYGRPLEVVFTRRGEPRRMVLRTMSPDPFGHSRRADRVAEMVLSADTFDAIPRHVRPHAVGCFDDQGRLVPLAPGEPWLLTDYVEGRLYSEDLDGLAGRDLADPLDHDRARALALYLAELHEEGADPTAWQRSVRDVVGSGEGIFGLTDSYPEQHPVASAARVREIELGAVRWRWKLKGRQERARRTHGDFHPFNLLFRRGTDFSVLDCSRGAAGEPADDVTALSINYLFFALQHRRRFDGALRLLWDDFWSTYLEASGDRQLLDIVAPFFTWRALVVASPVWYPEVAEEVRDQVLRFVERLLEGERFDPVRVEELLR